MNGSIESTRWRILAPIFTAILGLAAGFTESRLWAGTPAALTVSSSAFQSGGTIPIKYSCEGSDISPPLKWMGSPAGAKSFALICDDPDAPSGTWVHWVVYNLPPGTSELGEKAAMPGGAKQGTNDFGKSGYGGPCPPPSKPHRYFFKVYALDAEVGLKAGATKQELLKAMEGHVIGQGELIGKYQRRK